VRGSAVRFGIGIGFRHTSNSAQAFSQIFQGAREHLWTLALEEQFHFLAALLVLVPGRRVDPEGV
jgi:peptidoglycan/LPS O-acetylase OafA/YrhL